MPNRGRRVASRQAKISQQKKRGKGPSGIPTGPPQPPEPRKEDSNAVADQGPQAGVAPATPTLAPSTAAVAPFRRNSPVRRSETRARTLVYDYIGSEFRRIVLLSGAILALLIALAIFLN